MGLDGVEFVMALEEAFQIAGIPDEVAEAPAHPRVTMGNSLRARLASAATRMGTRRAASISGGVLIASAVPPSRCSMSRGRP